MGYSNRFNLSLSCATIITLPFCEKCDTFKEGKFCSDCGTTLIEKETTLNIHEIISKLRDYSEECEYLLGEDGDSGDEGTGSNIEKDIKEFSKRYPDIIFQLDTYYYRWIWVISFLFG